MKLRLPSLLRRLLISAMTVTGVTVGTSNSYGAIMNSDIPMTTYTDFGQNMGWYKTDADANALLTWIRKQQGGVTIDYTGGQETYTLEHKMINFTGVSDNGAFMSLGFNAITSVEHNGVFGGSFTSSYIGADNSIYYQGIEYRLDGSETFLHSPQGGWDKGGFDHKVTRMSKVITDVETATLFSGTSAEMRDYVRGEQLYHTGAGTMKMYDTETGTVNGLTGAYAYIVGGIETIDGAWAGGKDNNGDGVGDYDVVSTTFNKEGHESITTYEPLPFAGQQGDSGSPVFVYNTNTGQYEYIAAVQSIGGANSTHYYGGIDYVRETLSSYDKLVQSDADHATLRIGAVSTQGETISANDVAYNYGMEDTVRTTKWLGTVTGGAEDVSFVGVKSGINTWLDLSAVKDTNNWYNYGNAYLNAAPYITGANATAGKQLTYADLFVTENLVFAAGTASTDIILDATVDLGIGYAQFSLGGTAENPITSATFNISSGGDGSYQFNHAGYVIDAGVDVHTTLTGSATHMYEWRKVGAGNLHIEGSGDNNILLNVGGAGKTYLNRTDGYAAYNVLANTYATVVISDANQIARDFTFGYQGGVLDMNGNSMEWNNSNTDVAAAGFTIHALDEQAIVANLKSGSATTLTWTQGGAQTFLGSFADNGKDSALKFVYNGGEGASLALHSIKTSLTAPGSGIEVQSGTLSLSGTHTVHGTGSESGKNANRYHSSLDWHYADAATDVTVQNGGTFELGSHARLTGDVTVNEGGTFLMREGVQHAQEYVEGSSTLMNTDAISAFFGLKGDVKLSGGTMKVAYGNGVTVNNTYAGNITGSGSVEIDLGSDDARFTLAGKNTFTGAASLAQGLLLAGTDSLGSNVGWYLGSGGTLQVTSGLTAANALGLVHVDSVGTLALTEDMGALDMSTHAGLFIGAAEGQTIQYGTADESIAPAAGNYNLGGGGGELVVNAALSGRGNLVLGNGQGLGGIVTLTHAANSIGSITFNPGVTLSFSDAAALGGAKINLVYGSSLLGSSDSGALLDLIQSGSQGAILLDRAGNADFDMSNDGGVALSASGNVTYSGKVTVASDGTYRFGGGSGTLTLTQALAVNGSNGLIIDGQNSSGGKVILGAVSAITGQVKVQGYQANTTPALGDITLGFTVDNALASASGVIVVRGGVLDVGSTTQTLNNVQISVGGLLKGNSDGTLIFNMTGSGQSQYGAMQLGKAEKIGKGELCLTNTNYSWELLTIKEGTVFTQVDNALSATGTTRVEGAGVLNMNTWNGDGYRGRTMHGNVVLADGGTLSAGSGNDYAITFNGTIAVEAGSTGKLTNGSKWILNAAEYNVGGGTLVVNAPRLELNQTMEQRIGGTLDVGSSSVVLYSGGAATDMFKTIDHVNVASGKTLNIADETWNTIWQIDKLTGEGTLNWDSTTTHEKTARVILSGDGAFSGSINMLRRYNQGNRTHQAFLEINSENAASGATLNFAGTGASSYASLAINAENVNIGGLQSNVTLSGTTGTNCAQVFAGAAPEMSESSAARPSTRKATLTITGSGDYTYGGHIGSASDSTAAGLNLTMNGTGSQTLNGASIIVNDLSALQGTLNVQVNANTSAFTVLGNVNVAQGATLNFAPNVGYEDYNGYADFTLGSGHVLNVMDDAGDSTGTANFYANLLLGGGSINFDSTILSSSAPVLNLADGTKVQYAEGTSSLVITLSNTADLYVDNSSWGSSSTYQLSSDDWSAIDASSITLANMPHLNAQFNTSASGLSLTLSYASGSSVWTGNATSKYWTPAAFGQTFGGVTSSGVAVFDDSASNKTVIVDKSSTSSAITVAKIIFNASEDYSLTTNSEEVSLTASTLDQLGAGNTTLNGNITVSGATLIEDGNLVTTRVGQLAGAISGDGTLTVDWGQADATTSGMLNITGIGTLHVKSGVYTTGDNLEKFAADKVQVDAGATLTMGANTTMSSAVETAGTITTNSGEFTGGVTLTGDATVDVTANATALRSALSAADYTLSKTGSGTLQIAHTDIRAKQIDVQDGTMQIGVQVAEGLQSINLAAGSYMNAQTLRFDWGGGVTNTEILMGASSKLQVVNGGAGVIDAQVKLLGTGYLEGGRYNGSCVLDGTISAGGGATRTLSLANEESHGWTLASAISDGDGIVKIMTAPGVQVSISGDNSFSGGVTHEYGTITTSHSNALGTGLVTIGGYDSVTSGKLLLNKDLKVSALSSNGDLGVLSLNKKTLTVGAHDATTDATYTGTFNTALIGSLSKIGTNTQTFTNATVKVDDVSVQGGTLALTHADAQIVGNIAVGTETGEGVLNMAGTYTLSQDKTISILSTEQSTLGGLTLNGGFIELLGGTLSTEEGSIPALNITGAVQGDALTILLAGGMPTVAGEYLLLGGNFANVSAGGISVAVQESAMQTFGLARSGGESAELFSSVRTTEDGLYLVLSENTDSNIWAGDADNNTWSSNTFSVYGTSLVGTDATAIFDSTATNKSVNVSGDVAVGGMSISGGGYSFGGDGTISLSGQLSVSNGGDASTIDKIYIPTGPITVDGSELTIIELTPTNPSAPIELSNAAKLTIGDATHRYGVFSGLVTGDAGSQLHLYTTQVSGNYWQEDGRVHLLDGSTVQDVYIHGDLALNKFSNDGNQTNLQGANLHMDAGSQLVVRSSEATLTPTTGNIVLHGDLNLVTYNQVNAANTNLTTDFTLAEGATGKLIKTDSGSITLSGDINVTGVSVTGGKLVVDNAAGELSATGGLNLDANTAADITANTINFGTGNDSIKMAAGATATINGQSVTTGHVEIVNGATLTLQGGSYTFNGKIGAANNADSLIIFQGSAFATDNSGRNLNGTFRLESEATVTGGHLNIVSTGQLQLADGAHFNRTSGGNGDWLNAGKLVVLQDATAKFTSASDLWFKTGDNGKIELQSGSTLTMNVADLKYANSGTIELAQGATLDLTANTIARQTNGKTLAITLGADATATLHATTSATLGAITDAAGSALTLRGGEFSYDASAACTINGTLTIDSEVNVSGTERITIAPGGELILADGASMTRAEGNGGVYWVQGTLTTMQDATASFSSVDDVHLNYGANTGKIELQSGSTLNMVVKSLQMWNNGSDTTKGGELLLGENSTLNLTLTGSEGMTTTAASVVTLSHGSSFNILGGTVKINQSTLGVDGETSTITLAGGSMQMQNNGAQTIHSGLVVNENASLTNSVLSSATLLERNLGTVEIAADRTLTLWTTPSGTTAQSAKAAVKWSIDELSGAGTLKWDSWSYHDAYSSHLVLNGDGSNFTGEVYLDRRYDTSSGTHQTYVVLASENAVRNATVRLKGNKANGTASLAVDTAHAYIGGLQSEAGANNVHYAHIFAGAAPSAHNAGQQASTANNTLTITGANEYTFAGTVGKSGETAHLNLEMIGSGTQTFSGVAHVGDVSVSSGTLALSHADSKVHGNISVSGGALDFDGTYTLGAGQSLSIATATSEAASLAGLVLAGGEIIFDATALSADTAALSVGTLSLSEGTAGQTISLSNAASLTTNGTYLLATGDWTAAAADDFFTISGLRYGSTAEVRYENNALYLDYTAGTAYVWDANTASGSWNEANWEGGVSFTNGSAAVFRSTAAVTVDSATTVSDLLVENNAHLTLTETAALTATSIFVDAGSTLTFATAKAGRTERITGAGIVEVALTNSHGNALKLGADFAGETHVTSGYFTITDAQVGSKLVLANGVEMQTTAASGTTVTADVELLGAVKVHANGGKNITYTGSVIGTDVAVDYQAAASATHTFDGVADLHKLTTTDKATVNFNGQTTLGELANTSSNSTTVNFNGETSITTATISGANYTANIGATGEATITTTTISGGALNVNGTADITTANLSGGTLNVNGTADITTLAISTGTAAVGGTGQLDITTTNISGGTLELSTAQTTIGALNLTGGTLNLASAGLSVTGDLVMNNAAALHFQQAAGAATTYSLADVKMNASPGASAGSITIDSGVTVNAASLANGWGLGSLTVNGALNVSGELKYATGSVTNAISGSGTITTGSLTFSNYGTYNLSVEEMTVRGELNMLAEWVDSRINLNAGTLTVQGATNMKNGGNTRTLNISGGTLEMQGGGALAHGTLSLASGVLAQQGGETTISNTFNISGGELKVEGGKLTLSALNNVTGGAVTLSGGALDVTKELAAKLMNGAASFTMSGGVLDLADQSFTAGTAADAISLTNTAGLALNSGTLALGNLTAAGTYYLFTSGAEDVWDSFTAANVTLNGEKALRYGATLGYTEADGVTYATLTTTSDTAGNLTLYWDGGESGTWDGTQTNWNVAETLDGGMVDFNSGDSVVFNSNATVNATEAVQADTLTVNADATVSLSGSITANSIAVESGKLSITGSGTSATAYSVASGAELVFSGTADSAAASSALVNATGGGNLTLDGVDATWAYDNASEMTGKLTIRNATLTSDGFDGNAETYKTKTTYDLSSFTSVELDGAIVKFMGHNPTWQNVKVAAGGAEFSIRDMGTESSAFIFSGTTTLEGTLKLSTAGWKSQINIASLTGSGDINVVGAGQYVRVKIDSTSNYTGDIAVSGNLGRLILENASATSYGSAGATVTLSGANLWMNGNGALTLNSTLVVNNTAATAESPSISIIRNDSGNESMVRTLSSVSIAANNTLELQQKGWNTIWNIKALSGEGNLTWTSTTNHWTPSRLVLSGDGSDFTGNIKLDRTGGAASNRKYQIYMEVAANDAVKGATLDLVGQNANNVVSLAINADAVTMQGLKGNEHTHLYAGASPTHVGSSDADSALINAAFDSTADNTLTIAGGENYEFKGTVGTANETAHLNLAMIGSGTQTFSGVAHVGNVSVSNGSLALSNTGSVVHGDISVSGGSFTLGSSYTLGSEQVLSVLTGTENAVTLGGIVLAGGVLAFDASLLNTNTAALTLTGAATVGEGGATVTLDFANGVLADGRYKLAGGDWSAAAEGSIFTLSGLNYGSGTVSGNADGLWLTYAAASNVCIWTGSGDTNWDITTANWDNTPGTEGDSTAFTNSTADAATHAVFDGGEAMTLSIGSAISVDTLSVINGANVTLTRPQDNAESSLTVEHLVIANGTLTLGADGTQESNWTGIKDITIKQGGMLDFFYGNGMSSETLTPILLQGGTLNLRNGAGTHTALNAAISVDGYGTIGGSKFGDNSFVSGTISGHGELHFTKDLIDNDTHVITVSSTISDDTDGALALYVDSTSVKLTGTNTYTGGTVIDADGTLTITNAQAMGGSDGKLGLLSGEGTLVINLAAASDVAVAYDSNLKGFTGLVEVQQGALYVGNLSTENTGRDAEFNAERVLVHSGAQLITHMNGNDNTFSSDVDLMSGATFGNRDGHIAYNGDIRFNVQDATAGTFDSNGTVHLYEYWSKTLTFNGVISGQGTVEMASSINENGGATYVLTNGDNTFSGTYKLMDGSNSSRPVTLVLKHQNAAKDATISMQGSTATAKLQLDTSATIAALNSTNANNVVTTTGAYTLTVSSGSFAGKLQNGSGTNNTLSLTKQGNGTLTLSGANTYTGTTTVSGGTLEMTGAVSMNAASNISLANGTTLLLNATNEAAMTLGNAITGTGTTTIHKKGAYETVLSGNVTATTINVKDGTNQATNAGTLTLTGATVTADTLYAAYGQVNIGAAENGNTFMTVSKVELGDSNTSDSTNGLTIHAGSTLSVTGSNSQGGNSYKQASFHLSEWNSISTLNVQGKLLVQNAKVLIGDDAANINIAGGTMATQGITNARGGYYTAVTLSLSDNGTLILGTSGIDTDRPFTGTLGAGTVGMSAASTSIAEDVTLNSAEGTTFDTTQYAFETNTENVATDIVRGTAGGTMTISGNISSAEGVAAKMKVAGTGTLNMNGAQNTLSGGLEVEKGATVNVSTLASISAGESEAPATIDGAVRISHADGAATIEGTNADAAATVSNSLITIAQGASLRVENIVISETSRIQGATTYAARVAGVTSLTAVDTTIQLGSGNAEVAGQPATLAQNTLVSLDGTQTAVNMAGDFTTLTVTSNALSSLTLNAGSSLTIDFSSLLSDVQIANIDLIELSFADVNVDWTQDITITGVMNGNAMTAYYLAPTETAVANVGSIYFATDSIPEPTSTTLSILALAALAARRRRR